jgi:hypothetical protein
MYSKFAHSAAAAFAALFATAIVVGTAIAPAVNASGSIFA